MEDDNNSNITYTWTRYGDFKSKSKMYFTEKFIHTFIDNFQLCEVAGELSIMKRNISKKTIPRAVCKLYSFIPYSFYSFHVPSTSVSSSWQLLWSICWYIILTKQSNIMIVWQKTKSSRHYCLSHIRENVFFSRNERTLDAFLET